MPLLLYPFTDVVAFGSEHSTLARFVEASGRSMGIAVAPDPMPAQSLFVRSDHYRFVVRGVPAVFLMTGHANGGKQAWDEFLGNHYHRPSDEAKQAIDWNAAARFAELNYRIARQLADAPERPLWYRGSFFGERFAPGQKRAER
jgi:Zn-dependent M28 family amino/carboxypeptidase